MQINFYHLTKTPIGKALPKLLEKVTAQKLRAVVLAQNNDQVEQLNKELWTYTTKTFLAHGSKKDGYASKQPIYLTADNENPNNATVLAFVGNAKPTELGNYEKYLYMFDSNDESQLKSARALWKEYNNLGYKTIYWKQSPKGGWEQSA